MKITVHSIVKNEENYIWYVINSVIGCVDEMLVWDTGSTDSTVEIIKEAQKQNPDKISFREAGSVTPEGHSRLRQKMLEETKADWVLILDGDEVWWQDSIKKTIELIQKEGDSLDCLVHRYYNIVGDIYHFQEEKAGRYQIGEQAGHLNIRAVNAKISGLHFDKPYGQQGLFDADGLLLQERNESRRMFMKDRAYLHFTNMSRTRKPEDDLKVPRRKNKLKFELGIPFPFDFYYPEVFFRPRPNFVPSPWRKLEGAEYFRAAFETPFKKLKRIL